MAHSTREAVALGANAAPGSCPDGTSASAESLRAIHYLDGPRGRLARSLLYRYSRAFLDWPRTVFVAGAGSEDGDWPVDLWAAF